MIAIFRFLKTKTYKKAFIQYFIWFTLFILISGIIAYSVLLSSAEKTQREREGRYFANIEDRINNNKDQIDQYMHRIYSSSALLTDFIRFFDSNAEQYTTSRVDSNVSEDVTTNFTKDLKAFVKNRNLDIKKIYFYSDNNLNIINYTNSGSEYNFNAPYDENSLKHNNLSYGYLYTQNVTSLTDYNKIIGRIVFLIDTPAIFKSTDSSMLFNANIATDTNINKICDNNLLSNQITEEFYQKENLPSFNVLDTVHYNVFTSTINSYKLITAYTNNNLISNDSLTFIIILVLIFCIYIIVLFIIAVKLNQDAKALHNILSFIKYAEDGEFTLINSSRNDEYGQIAKALDKMGHKMQDYIKREYIYNIEQQKAEMKALQNQINPHFLYNTLEIIRYRANENDDKEVSNAIENLGGLFRDIVKKEAVITLKDELSILKRFLDLMQFRYPNSFTYLLDIDETLLTLPSGKCWMQPIVENFFKYGFDKNSEFNLVVVEGTKENNHITLKFINNGISIEKEKLTEINSWFDSDVKSQSENLGLKNVYSRLKILYGNSLEMSINNRDDNDGVEVIINFDYEGDSDVQTYDN